MFHDPFTSRSSGRYSEGTPVFDFPGPDSSYVTPNYGVFSHTRENLGGTQPSRSVVAIGLAGLVAYVLFMSWEKPKRR